MIAEWLEHLACNAEYRLEPPMRQSFCSYLEQALHLQVLGAIDVQSYGRVCTSDLWKKGNIRYSCIV